MQKHPILGMVFMLICTLVCANGFAATQAAMDTSLAPMLQKILPAIVNIRAQIKITDVDTLLEMQKRRSRNNKEAQPQDQMPLSDKFVSAGSGVIVDANNGYILTNAHVVNDAQSITVTLGDTRHYTAKIIGSDRPSDVALLQIKAKNLTAITISDSNELKVGDFVAAIGNPFGLSQSVTSGLVSALGRTTLGIEIYENFIQTDAPINPGNSGGALVNMKGELVGLNTAILAPDRGSIGIGFAIPSNMAKSVMQQLIQFGDIRRGLLGVGAQNMTPELAAAFNVKSAEGAAVTQIMPGSPAAASGLKEGDIISAVNGSKIKSANELINTVGFLRVDSKLNLEILRDNKLKNFSVILADPKKRKASVEQMDPFLYGVGLKNFSILSPVFGPINGVLIISVSEDSLAWNSDLRPGDVITSANQTEVHGIEQLKQVIAKANQSVLMHVLRGPTAIYLVLNKEN